MENQSLEGWSCDQLVDMEMPLLKCQPGLGGQPLMTHQPNMLNAVSMMNDFESEQSFGFLQAKGLTLGGTPMDIGKGKGVCVGRSCSTNTTSEDEEPSFSEDANGENSNMTVCGKEPHWQRMKWTDKVIRLLIIVVASVGDDFVHEADGSKRKFGMMHKKGKWKLVSNIMISKGSCVSPQQCEDKFNDLNKRYKKLNDILGRGTCCNVVENPSLMDSMPNLSSKEKDEVRKILSSKHLFYREMCAYHNGKITPGCLDIDLKAHLATSGLHPNVNGVSEEQSEGNSESDDGDSYGDEEKNVEACYTSCSMNDEDNPNFPSLPSRQDGIKPEMAAMFQDMTKSPAQQREWIQQQIWQLEEEKVKLQAEALGIEKQRFKWLRFCSKKDGELEKLRLDNERMKLENDRKVLLLKHKGLALGILKAETSPERTSLNDHGVQGRDGINSDRLQ